jgi:prepilin-type N-terminal cleavage/methylation domain-containing protein
MIYTKAFTLIETLVAISVLSLAVVGPLYTASRATLATNLTHDKVIASYLAQEGAEYMRATRDTYFLENQSSGWNTFVATMDSTCATACSLDTFSSALQSCFNGVCPALRLYNNKYQLTSGDETQFTRTISAEISSNDDTVTITSEVSWAYHNLPYRVKIVTLLRPWQ